VQKLANCLVLAAWLAGCSRTALASPPDPAAQLDLPGEASPRDKKKKPSEKIGERVSRGFIDESLETLDTPENRARLGRILSSPEMQDAVHDLTAALVLGAFDGVRTGRAGMTIDGESIRVGIERQVTPAAGRFARRVIDSALDAALTDEHIARVEILGKSSTHAAVEGLANGIREDLGPALAATLEKDLGPALAIVIERDLVPAMARGLNTPEMQLVVANLTRSFAAEFVTGAGRAIDSEAEKSAAQGKESGLQVFGTRVARGYAIALFVAFALGTMAIVLTVVLVRNSRRLRQQSKAAAERETALLHLIDNLETENPELKADLRKVLERQLEHPAV
jgi:hypothetical protein